MAPVQEAVGEILVANPEGGEGRLRPDVGVVVAVGKPRSSEITLKYGDNVLVDHSHGKWVEGLSKNQLRFYGARAESGGVLKGTKWWRSVLAVMTNDGLIAKGRQVIIDRGDVQKQSEGGVYLPDSATRRSGVTGTLISVGEQCDPELKEWVGKDVVYFSQTMKPIRGYFGFTDGNKYEKNYGLIFEEGVLSKVNYEVA